MATADELPAGRGADFEPSARREPSGAEFGFSNAELTAELLANAGSGVSVEEPLDSGLWPTVPLSEGAITALIEAVHEVQRREHTAAALSACAASD